MERNKYEILMESPVVVLISSSECCVRTLYDVPPGCGDGLLSPIKAKNKTTSSHTASSISTVRFKHSFLCACMSIVVFHLFFHFPLTHPLAS